MEENIRGFGKMVNNMEMENFFMMKEKAGKKEIGVKGKELDGQKIKMNRQEELYCYYFF